MLDLLRPALMLLGSFTLLTGLSYPLAVTGLAQAVFPHQANGSLTEVASKPLGSKLVGQPFTQARYFWGRPSSTAPVPYNGVASSGSNLGPSNPALLDLVRARIVALRAADPTAKGPVPVDLVTASASGLDPEISPAAALYQVGRVAQARGLAPERIRALVAKHSQKSLAGALGEPRVNVLELNLALDQLASGGA